MNNDDFKEVPDNIQDMLVAQLPVTSTKMRSLGAA